MNITKCRFFISLLSVSFRKVHSLYKNIQVYTSIFFGWTHPLRDIFRLNYIKWHVFRGSHIGTLFISVDNRLHFTEKRCFRFVSQSTDFSFRFVPFRFAKYRFFISFRPISFRPISFRKVQIFYFVSSHFVSSHFVSQSTDFLFRFAKYRFFISFRPISFRKVQIFYFVSSHFVS